MSRTENENRILAYVTGLLYYYGVMAIDDLYNSVGEQIEGVRFADFLTLIEQNVLDDDSPYVFDFEDGVCFDIEVEDSEWVLAQQQKQASIPFRLVNEDEGAYVVEDRYPLLWVDEEQAFFTWLVERCGNDCDLALALILDYAALLKNGLEPLELAKKIVMEMELSGVEEVQEVAELIMKFADATPQWILKGWRESEMSLEDRTA